MERFSGGRRPGYGSLYGDGPAAHGEPRRPYRRYEAAGGHLRPDGAYAHEDFTDCQRHPALAQMFMEEFLAESEDFIFDTGMDNVMDLIMNEAR